MAQSASRQDEANPVLQLATEQARWVNPARSGFPKCVMQ